jgi:GNAT superfamily N-acetyltransferase
VAGALTIRRAAAGDEQAWSGLWTAWQSHMGGRVPEDVSASAWTQIITPGSGLFALLALSDEGALGFANVSATPFAWTAGPILFLQDLYVAPEARGRGLGRSLLQAVYDEADALGAAQVFWMVDELDSDLQAFYARQGIRTPYLRYMRRPWSW